MRVRLPTRWPDAGADLPGHVRQHALGHRRGDDEPLTEPVHCSPLGAHIVRLPIDREAALTHSHEGEEWVTVLAGVCELVVDGTPHVLREGDCLHFRAHRTHSYSNLASEPAVLLVASRPQLAI